jgi:hypothetical protein
VHGLEGEGFEDQEVDAAAEGIGLGGVAGGHGRLLSLEVERRIGCGSLEVKRCGTARLRQSRGGY